MSEHGPTTLPDDDTTLPDDDTTLPDEFEDREPLQYFCRLTFGQFFTLLVLLVITVCAAFYLGARYGNNYLRLDGLPQHDTARLPSAQAPAPPINASQQEAIQDSELKRLARQALQREQQQQLEQQVEAYLNAPVPSQPPAPQPAAQPMPQASPSTHAVPPPPPQPPAVSQLAGDAGMPYAVQVGAYRNYEEATTHLENWKAKGYPAYLLSADIPDSGRWYRVRVGAFATRNDAQAFREDFSQREAIDGIVVRNE